MYEYLNYIIGMFLMRSFYPVCPTRSWKIIPTKKIGKVVIFTSHRLITNSIIYIQMPEAHLEPSQTSMMELFSKIVKG